MTPSAALLGIPLFCHGAVLYMAMEIPFSSGLMALLTIAAAFVAGLLLGSRHHKRWELVVPAACWMPLVMSWFDLYGPMDMYSPHAALFSFAAKQGFPSKAGIVLYAVWLGVTALLGWKTATASARMTASQDA